MLWRERAGDLELELLPEVGGRVHRLRFEGLDLLRTPNDIDLHRREPRWWGSYPLVPWCNHIPGGILRFGDRHYRQTELQEAHASHGRCWSAPWTRRGDRRITFEDPGDEGFPWPYRAWQEFTLDDRGLTWQLGIENTGAAPMPAGIGIHPWFDAEDPLEVRLPADLVYPSIAGIPSGEPVAVTGIRDLRRFREPEWDLVEGWTGLTENRVDVRRPLRGIGVRLSFSATADHVVLAAMRRFASIAIEPQTHAVDGHRLHEEGRRGGVAALGPGELLVVDYRLSVGAIGVGTLDVD